MLDEISAAVLFLARLIEKSENFNQVQLEDFKAQLSELLVERFRNHWFPEQPFKGQGYRCIRVNKRNHRDATLERAAIACGLKYDDLKLPMELTLWVDPNEVCCRFGEHGGSYCTLASFNDKENKETINKAEKRSSKDTKLQKSPMTPSNHRSRKNLSPKQMRGSPRANKAWVSPPMFQPPPLHSWCNMVPPQWSSPTMYHPLFQSNPMGKQQHHSHRRYPWHNYKPTVKV